MDVQEPNMTLMEYYPILTGYHPRMRIGNNFRLVCVGVFLSICSGNKIWTFIAKNYIFSLQIHLDRI